MDFNISIKEVPLPMKGSVDRDIRWLCDTFCLFQQGETDFNVIKILKFAAKKAACNETVENSDLAEKLGVSRATCIHHLKKLESMRLIRREGSKYALAGSSFENTFLRIKQEIDLQFQKILRMCEEIDREMGFKERWPSREYDQSRSQERR